jgi:hydroxycarboxylate dehydrogenase B
VFRNGTLIVTLDPARFLPLADFHAQVAALLAWVRTAPLAADGKEILIPGEPEARMERERRTAGVPIEDETWRQIRDCAERAGVHA